MLGRAKQVVFLVNMMTLSCWSRKCPQHLSGVMDQEHQEVRGDHHVHLPGIFHGRVALKLILMMLLINGYSCNHSPSPPSGV